MAAIWLEITVQQQHAAIVRPNGLVYGESIPREEAAYRNTMENCEEKIQELLTAWQRIKNKRSILQDINTLLSLLEQLIEPISSSISSSNITSPKSKAPSSLQESSDDDKAFPASEVWITVTMAKKITGFNKGVISR
ncbi:MAG TPA: hypothetical protein ENO27_03135, partial [Caldithrix sp.]|nr:hypothetical protein [Caldithrix sp.]